MPENASHSSMELGVYNQNSLNNNILLYLVIFCIFTIILKNKKVIVLGTIIVIITFNMFLENDYHYTDIVSSKNTNCILVVEYDLPLNSEMVIYKKNLNVFIKKEIYQCTEYNFYPFF